MLLSRTDDSVRQYKLLRSYKDGHRAGKVSIIHILPPIAYPAPMRPFPYDFTGGSPGMHHHNHWHHQRWARRGPSRLLWFLIGGVSGLAWVNHRDKHHGFLSDDSWRRGWHSDSSRGWAFGQAWRSGRDGNYGVDKDWPKIDATPGPFVEGSSRIGFGRSAGKREDVLQDTSPQSQSQRQTMTRPIVGAVIPPKSPNLLAPNTGYDWDLERERVKDVGRQLLKSTSELSEAKIDAMLTGLQNLKQRLAEHRTAMTKEPVATMPAELPQPSQETTA